MALLSLGIVGVALPPLGDRFVALLSLVEMGLGGTLRELGTSALRGRRRGAPWSPRPSSGTSRCTGGA